LCGRNKTSSKDQAPTDHGTAELELRECEIVIYCRGFFGEVACRDPEEIKRREKAVEGAETEFLEPEADHQGQALPWTG